MSIDDYECKIKDAPYLFIMFINALPFFHVNFVEDPGPDGYRKIKHCFANILQVWALLLLQIFICPLLCSLTQWNSLQRAADGWRRHWFIRCQKRQVFVDDFFLSHLPSQTPPLALGNSCLFFLPPPPSPRYICLHVALPLSLFLLKYWLPSI